MNKQCHSLGEGKEIKIKIKKRSLSLNSVDNKTLSSTKKVSPETISI